MKFIVFCAVAFACVAPMWNLWRIGVIERGSLRGLVTVVLFEAVLVPLAWAGLCFLVVKRGAWRDGLITILLLGSVSVALSIAMWLFFLYTLPAFGTPRGTTWGTVGVHVAAIAALGVSAGYLLRRLRVAHGIRRESMTQDR